MKKYLFMKVTKDEYELPLAVADSVAELARITGVSAGSIRSAISTAKKHGYKSQYIKVEISEGVEND